MTDRAWALSGGFGIDNLRVEARAPREPGAGEARVRIEWVSLNRRDLLLVEGVYNPRQTLPVVPCSDGAGTVEAVGPGCARVRPGGLCQSNGGSSALGAARADPSGD